MKAKFMVGTICFFLVLISGLIILSTTLNNSATQTISYGVLTSSLVVLICTIGEYYPIKRATLEDYYVECDKQIGNFSRIKFLNTVEINELIVDCFRERGSYIYDFSPILSNKKFKKYCNYNKKFYPMVEEAMIEKISFEKLQDIEKKINSVAKCYIDFTKMDFFTIDHIYGQIYSPPCSKVKKNIYTRLHKPISDMRKLIIEEVELKFKPHLSEEDRVYNIPVILSSVNRLQSLIYDIEINYSKDNNDSHAHIRVKKKFSSSIDNNLEEFRCLIYQEKYTKKEDRIEFETTTIVPDLES